MQPGLPKVQHCAFCYNMLFILFINDLPFDVSSEISIDISENLKYQSISLTSNYKLIVLYHVLLFTLINWNNIVNCYHKLNYWVYFFKFQKAFFFERSPLSKRRMFSKGVYCYFRDSLQVLKKAATSKRAVISGGGSLRDFTVWVSILNYKSLILGILFTLKHRKWLDMV